jgi:mannosyltransferase
MATVTDRRPLISLHELPGLPDVGSPGWFERRPRLAIGALLVALLAVSAYIRTRYLSGQLWYAEADAIGIASHHFTQIPGLLRAGGGGAPLYYWLLHFWIDAFGLGEGAARGLSLLLGLVSIPVALWLGWSLFGRRGGLIAAALLAFSAFFTKYADEAAPYELLALLSLVALAAFVHTFIDGRRAWRWVLCACLALMLYTDVAAVFLWSGAAFALVPLVVAGERRREIVYDAALAFGLAALAYVPWIPTVVHQASTATDPFHYAPLPGTSVPKNLLGSDRVWVTLAVAAVVGLAPLLVSAPRRRSRDGQMLITLLAVILGVVVLERLVALGGVPVWTTRYLAPAVAAALLLAAFACARSGVVGVAALVLACVFTADPGSFVAPYKSDMREVAGEVSSYLRPGEEVLVSQPEQAPLAYYYLPGGLRYATALGADPHPGWTNWDDAYGRLLRANPRAAEARLVASLHPGQRLLFIRPLTEGEKAWAARWSALVRRRAAQWGAALSSDPRLRPIAGAWAPHDYLGSCCIASSALVYARR